MSTLQDEIDATKSDFCIEIHYKKESENPARVFRAMSELIDSIQDIDKNLVKAIDIQIEPTLLLEDIEAGSIRTWLLYVLKRVPDDSIYHLDWKPIVGQYLVKTKHIMVNFLEGRTTITNMDEIKPVQDQIYQLAEDTRVRWFPDYSRIQPRELLQGMQKISSSLANLSPDDDATYITPTEQARFNLSFRLAPESIEDLLAREILESQSEMILKVKKPDYLGESMWDFRFGDRTIPISLLDKEWLDKFQSRKVDVRPGDSVRGIVQIKHKYDYDGELISTRYDMTKIIEVIPMPSQEQPNLFEHPPKRPDEENSI